MSEHKNILDDESRAPDNLTPAATIVCRRSDKALQLSRRIDWRFLLPDPRLRRVAYLGRDDETLLAALRQFSDSLRQISLPYSETDAADLQSCCNLAVVHSSSLGDALKASSLLVANGHLYWEIDRFNWLTCLQESLSRNGRAQARHKSIWQHRWLGAMRPVYDYIDVLERLGFSDIQIHWHRPNFKACLEIIPLRDRRALDYVFSRPDSDVVSRLELKTGRYMMTTGLLFRLVPCFSLIACKT